MVGGNLVGVMGVEVLEATLGGRAGGTKPGGGGSLVITRVFCVLWSDFLPKSRKIFEKKLSLYSLAKMGQFFKCFTCNRVELGSIKIRE